MVGMKANLFRLYGVRELLKQFDNKFMVVSLEVETGHHVFFGNISFELDPSLSGLKHEGKIL